MTQYVGEPRKLEVAYGTSAYITEPRRLEVAYPGPGISTGAVVWSEHSMDANTKILLHLNGEQGSTTFTDESSKAWTKVGNAMITTGQYKLGGASGQFVEATNDWIHTPDHADFYIGTGDYTIEFFVRFSPLPPSFGSPQFVFGQWDNDASCHRLALYNYSGYYWNYDVNGASVIWRQHVGIAAETWYHIAISRSSGITRFFIDGIKIGADISTSYNIANYINSFHVAECGTASGGGDGLFRGNLDEFRLSNTCRYASEADFITDIKSTFVAEPRKLEVVYTG